MKKIIAVTSGCLVFGLILISFFYYGISNPDDGPNYPSMFNRCEGIKLEKVKMKTVSLPLGNCLEAFRYIYGFPSLREALFSFENVSGEKLNYAHSTVFEGDYPYVVIFHINDYYHLKETHCSIHMRADGSIRDNQLHCFSKSGVRVFEIVLERSK